MEGFAEGVVAFERQIHAVLPFRQRVNRAVSVLEAYAMRPQPTMAALLLLIIGASLFLVRARPAERDLVQITERGVPEVDMEQSDNKNANFANTFATSSTASTQTLDSPSELPSTPESTAGVAPDTRCAAPCKFGGSCEPDAGTSEGKPSDRLVRSSCSKDIPCDDSSLPMQPNSQSAISELERARAIRRASGCSAAIQPFEAIRRRYPSSEATLAATWDVAECYYKTNHTQDARALFELLHRVTQVCQASKITLSAIRSQ